MDDIAFDSISLVVGAYLHDEVADEAGKAFVYSVRAP